MGRVPAAGEYTRPLSDSFIKQLVLPDGFVAADDLAMGARGISPYLLLPFVREPAALHARPNLPTTRGSGGAVVRAFGATLVIELRSCCAVIDPSEESLPWLNSLDLKPSLIALTHAHHDHTGGVLDAIRMYPEAAVVMSQLTLDLLPLNQQEAFIAIGGSIGDRGLAIDGEGAAYRLGNLTVRGYPAGHVPGATMIDLEGECGRLLVTGDFALRSLADQPGGAWPTAGYDAVLMSATHAWNTTFPTSDTSTNRKPLITACEKAESQGAVTVVIIANAIGEAQEVYIALCRAQMAGRLARYRISINGRGAEIAQKIARANADPFSPWALPIVELSGRAGRNHSCISIVSEDRWSRMSADETGDACVIKPTVVPTNNPGTHYPISLHASWFELYATALALRTNAVGLYHCGENAHQSPLREALVSCGRRAIGLDTTPNLL